jgi:osmotically inducible lipoprotein OsmB
MIYNFDYSGGEKMKRFTALLLIVLLVAVAGCTGTQKGAGLGTLIGAGAGAIIGHQSGRAAEGALIGGAAGAAGGALIGDAMMTKFCPTCGKQFGTDVQFCPDDGAELKPIQK